MYAGCNHSASKGRWRAIPIYTLTQKYSILLDSWRTGSWTQIYSAPLQWRLDLAGGEWSKIFRTMYTLDKFGVMLELEFVQDVILRKPRFSWPSHLFYTSLTSPWIQTLLRRMLKWQQGSSRMLRLNFISFHPCFSRACQNTHVGTMHSDPTF